MAKREETPSEPGRRPTRAELDQRLSAARRLLASGRPAEARAKLEPLLALRLEPHLHAEARSLFAECAQAEGDHEAAARAYREVAARHGEALAGESALFAQARAEMRAGRTRDARETLRRYLDRFPQGRFRQEALQHLSTLEAP
jgi:tetratricopeptide (TPR) repeat protein